MDNIETRAFVRKEQNETLGQESKTKDIDLLIDNFENNYNDFSYDVNLSEEIIRDIKSLSDLDKAINNVQEINERQQQLILNALSNCKKTLEGLYVNKDGIREKMSTSNYKDYNRILLRGINDLLGDLSKGIGKFKIDDPEFQSLINDSNFQSILSESITISELPTNPGFEKSLDGLEDIINKNTDVIIIDTGINLNGTGKDVKYMKQFLMQNYHILESEIHIISGNNATKHNILKLTREVSKKAVDENDSMLIFYVGHGVKGEEVGRKEGKTYLVTSENFDKQTNTVKDSFEEEPILISPGELSNVIYGKTFFIADACHSGRFISHLAGHIGGLSTADNGYASDDSITRSAIGKYYSRRIDSNDRGIIRKIREMSEQNINGISNGAKKLDEAFLSATRVRGNISTPITTSIESIEISKELVNKQFEKLWNICGKKGIKTKDGKLIYRITSPGGIKGIVIYDGNTSDKRKITIQQEGGDYSQIISYIKQDIEGNLIKENGKYEKEDLKDGKGDLSLEQVMYRLKYFEKLIK